MDRTRYILLSNTKSRYLTLIFGKGVINDSHYIERALRNIREFMKAYEKSFNDHLLIDLVTHATIWLIEGRLSPYDVGFKLNEIPFSSLNHLSPRVMFKNLASE